MFLSNDTKSNQTSIMICTVANLAVSVLMFAMIFYMYSHMPK